MKGIVFNSASRALALALALLLSALPVRAQETSEAWSWPLPPRRFSGLSQPDRVLYTRAEDLLRKKDFEGAAAEFEKFVMEHPKSPVNAHCLLLRGYALQEAKQRNAAIAVYTELLDFNAEQVEDAVPAMYLMGRAQIENGNVDDGMRTFKQLADNEKYLNHPLADLALNQLADYDLANKDEKGAEACWLKVVSLYAAAFMRPEHAATEARNKLTDLYVRQQRYSALEELLAKGTEDPKKLTDVAVAVYQRAIGSVGQTDAAGRDAFLKWFLKKQNWFKGADRLDDFYSDGLTYAQRAAAKDEWGALVQEALAYAKALPVEKRSGACVWLAQRLSEADAKWGAGGHWTAFSALVLTDTKPPAPAADQLAFYGRVIDAMRSKREAGSPAAVLWDSLVSRSVDLCKSFMGAERDQGLATLIDRLLNADSPDRALAVAGQIENAALARWKTIEILGCQKKYAEMAKACEDLEKMDDKNLAMQALRTRAGLYKDQLARYEDAIRLYNAINDPPGTVWAIVDCYTKAGKPDEAVSSCTEIENFFESEAPAAAFRKAQIWQGAGNTNKAIAACRVVMKKYPKSQPSSEAHQMLEKYGIKTGGGVVEGGQ